MGKKNIFLIGCHFLGENRLLNFLSLSPNFRKKKLRQIEIYRWSKGAIMESNKKKSASTIVPYQKSNVGIFFFILIRGHSVVEPEILQKCPFIDVTGFTREIYMYFPNTKHTILLHYWIEFFYVWLMGPNTWVIVLYAKTLKNLGVSPVPNDYYTTTELNFFNVLLPNICSTCY